MHVLAMHPNSRGLDQVNSVGTCVYIYVCVCVCVCVCVHLSYVTDGLSVPCVRVPRAPCRATPS